MKKRSLLDAVREIVERVSRTVKEGVTLDAYLAGGIATYVHTADKIPSGDTPRYSEDADIHFVRSLNLPDEIVVTYQDHAGMERALMLDRTYTAHLGLCHPDAFDHAKPLFRSRNGRVRLRILTPLDLAVTKTGRFQDHDRQDIEALARCGLLDADEFDRHAQEAIEHLATDPKPVQMNIRDAIELIRRAKPKRA